MPSPAIVKWSSAQSITKIVSLLTNPIQKTTNYCPRGQPTHRLSSTIPRWTHFTSLQLAEATVPCMFRGANIQIGSFDNQAGTYLSETIYRAGATNHQGSNPGVTVTFTGKFTSLLQSGAKCMVIDIPETITQPKIRCARITIDGNFDDWRNVAGIDDPRGDLVPYLEYIADVDLLEFKVAHDNTHIFLYARVAGQVGHSHPHGGRSYFYAYMDVDRNSNTGFLPSRDDDCYYGVDTGSTRRELSGQTTNRSISSVAESLKSPRTLNWVPATPSVWPFLPTAVKSKWYRPSPVS